MNLNLMEPQKLGASSFMPAMVASMVIGAVIVAAPAGANEESDLFETDLMELEPSNFEDSANIDNPWWPMKPGMQAIYEGETMEDGEALEHRVVFTVTDLTKVIGGVKTRVVYDTDYTEGRLLESELRFFAQDKDGNIWNIGEYREVYDETELVGGRLWAEGFPSGAKAGVMMWADPQPGKASYSQGYAPPPFNWTDRAEVYKLDETVEVPFGSFENVLVTREFSKQEPNAFQLKFYARDVGNIAVGWSGDDPLKEELHLVKQIELGSDELAEVRATALELESRAYMYSETAPAVQDR